jgi:hypothetical protein
VLIEVGYLNDLATFPALGEHGTFFPVVNVERFIVEAFILAATEAASLIIRGLVLGVLQVLLTSWTHPLLVGWRVLDLPPSLLLHGRLLTLFFIVLLWLARWSSDRRLLGTAASFTSMRIDVCDYSFLRGIIAASLLGLSVPTIGCIDLCKGSLELLELGSPQAIELLSYGLPHHPIELTHALIGNISDVLEVVLDAFKRELNTTLHLLLIGDIIGLKDSLQDLISANNMLIGLHVFLGVFFLL